MTVILHVEDDHMLGALVALTFESLGFHGRTITAESVQRGEQILDEAARTGLTFDLILSDMHLPDGTGLDLVRYVRGSAAWKTTPMLILSGDHDPGRVSQAYALGANAYVSKSPPGRTLDEVIRALYEHWIKDVVPSRTADGEPATDVVQRSINMRLRHAHLYQRLADRFARDRSESAFWMSRVLGESNLINILGFVQHQLSDHELPTDTVVQIQQMQDATAIALDAFERELDRNSMSRDDVYLRVLQIHPLANLEMVARSMARMFPVIPVAVATLRDFLLGNLHELSAWIDLHATSPAVRERAQELRDAALRLRSNPC